MPVEFKLPDVGEGIAEGEIVKWLVDEGDSVIEDQPLLEVMTDKATVEITSPADGSILSIHAAEGDIVPVGDLLVVIGDASGNGSGVTATAETSDDTAASGAAKAEKKEAPAKKEAPTKKAPAAPKAAPARKKRSGPVRAAPATRKLARELGVDIQELDGTGPNGRVVDADVRAHAEGGRKGAPAAAEPALPKTAIAAHEQEERIPVRGLRRRIVQSMTVATRKAAHFSYVDEVDMTELVRFHKQLKPEAAERGIKLTYLAYCVKAIIPALKKFPWLNASLDEEANEIVLKKRYNIGLAVATEQGLSVPVIQAVDQKDIFQLAKEMAEAAERARTGKSTPDDFKDGTFTVTSTGSIGGLLATPVVNYPEVAIMGVHQMKKRPVVRDDQIVIGHLMNLSMSLDHRVVDGAVAAHFLNEVIRRLEKPALLFVD